MYDEQHAVTDAAAERTALDLVAISDLRKHGLALKWHWEGWIMESALTLVSADAGTGKTRVVADLVRRIRHGDTWPDGTTIALPQDTPVIWVAADCQFPELLQLHDDFRLGGKVYLNSWRDDPLGGTSLDTDHDRSALEHRIELSGAKLLVVDTLGNATDADLCRQEEAKRFAVPLMHMAADLNLAVLLLYHHNREGKPLGRRIVERRRTCIALKRPDGGVDGDFNLSVEKSFAVKPASLRGAMAGGGIDYTPATGPGRPCSQRAEAETWILDQLQDDRRQVAPLQRSAEQAGIAKNTFFRARDRLVEAGTIRQTEGSPKYLELPGAQNPFS